MDCSELAAWVCSLLMQVPHLPSPTITYHQLPLAALPGNFEVWRDLIIIPMSQPWESSLTQLFVGCIPSRVRAYPESSLWMHCTARVRERILLQARTLAAKYVWLTQQRSKDLVSTALMLTRAQGTIAFSNSGVNLPGLASASFSERNHLQELCSQEKMYSVGLQ